MRQIIRAGIGVAAVLLLTGCATATSTAITENGPSPTGPSETEPPTDVPKSQTPPDLADETPPASPTGPSETEPPTDVPKSQTPPDLADETPPAGASREFTTDFSIHSVSYAEILSGGPPKDGIPPIDDPQYVTVSEADEWLRPQEPVVLVEMNGEARAYPIQILVWHEIVNDNLGGEPISVTFCPLCNTAIIFDRRVGEEILDFGTTGRLRFLNLIMYDRQTETWWQQASGEAIAGELTGTRLAFLPGQMLAWQDFKDTYPDSLVLSRWTGHNRPYGNNPYPGYDDINNNSPFQFLGQADSKLPAMARVLTVELDGAFVAYRYDQLSEHRVANDVVAGQPLVVFWAPGTESAFNENASTQEYADVGTAISYSAVVNDQTLTFQPEGEGFIDEQTGSLWNLLGEAVEGPLAGSRLEQVVGINHFWFSWVTFRPETRIFEFPE